MLYHRFPGGRLRGLLQHYVSAPARFIAACFPITFRILALGGLLALARPAGAQLIANGGMEGGTIFDFGTTSLTARTGTRSVETPSTSSSASSPAALNCRTGATVPPGQYAHVLLWTRAANSVSSRAFVSGRLPGQTTLASEPVAVSTTAFQRLVYNSAQNDGSTSLVFSWAYRYYRTCTSLCTGSASFFIDDVVMYVDDSPTADLTAPSAPTALLTSPLSATTLSLRWTAGTDDGSGVQGSVVLRTTNLSAAAPSLNDQALYTTAGGTGPSTVGAWTVIGSLSGGATTFTDNGTTDMTVYRYAVIHHDAAYNYSTALVSAPVRATPYPPSAAPALSATNGILSSPGSGASGYVGSTVTLWGTNLGAVTSLKVGGTTHAIASRGFTNITFKATGVSGPIELENDLGTYTSSTPYTSLGYISTAAGDWSNPGSWLHGAEPPIDGIPVTLGHSITISRFAIVSNLTVNSSATLSVNNGSTLTVKGPLANNGSLLINGTLELAEGSSLSGTGVATVSNGLLRLSGTSPQTLPASAFGGSVAALQIDNAAGVALSGNLSVTSNLDLNAGHLTLGAANLTTAGISKGSVFSFVVTNGTGSLTRKALNGYQLMPVGLSASSYSPVSIQNAQGRDWTVRVAAGIAPAGGTWHADKAIQRTWNITPSGIPGSTTLTFQYNTGDDGIKGDQFNEGRSVLVNHYNSTSTRWESVAGTTQNPAPEGGVFTIFAFGVTAFSPFAVSNSANPLPVSLLTFSGKRSHAVIELKWSTANEQHNRGFAVERSADGVNFGQVAFVNSRAAGGNSMGELHYSFSESISAGAKWYYRLKQEDLDGRSKYSSVVLLKGEKHVAITVEGIYPNPVKGAASIRLQASARGGHVLLQLTDMQGRLVKAHPVLMGAGAATTVDLDLTGLPAGTYHLKAIAADGEASETLTVLKQ